MKVVSINTAAVQDLLTAQGLVPSAIRKQPCEGRVTVGELGLAGDEQADPRYHGGPAKAVYAYPQEHYEFWRTVRAQAKVDGELSSGGLGENLTLSGLLEAQVWQGDVLRFPDCELVVSEPRQPCFKFNAVMGFSQASKMMVQSGFCGFYLAVKRPGTLAAGEAFELLPGPREVGIREWFRAKMSGKA
ncbi:MAG: MOSC domain-containing protein [Roseateles depolymerans]|uniref:MOSC domain-containing protein n=1 Tax=Roseateles depolymerans TaxID=76731 RepID=A0A2W5DTB1_9BURK|nr:MAG: MOSC domain-containing protein [Roseateles depolymerans]